MNFLADDKKSSVEIDQGRVGLLLSKLKLE